MAKEPSRSEESVGKAKTEKPSTKDILLADLETFTDRVIDLSYGFPNIMRWTNLASRLAFKELDDFVKSHGKSENLPDGKSVKHAIPLELLSEYKRLSRIHSSANAYYQRLPSLHLVSLVEELDLILGSIISTILEDSGSDARLSEKSLDYGELKQFASIDDARDHLVSREVDRVLRDGVVGQLKWLAGVGIKIPLSHPFVRRTVELSERRNCEVHNDGYVNRSYITNCSAASVEVGTLKEGDKFSYTQTYMERAFETCIVFAIMLFAGTWIKVCKKQDSKWDDLLTAINNVVYNLMVDTKFSIAKSILELTFADINISPTDTFRRMLKVNLANCCKSLGDKPAALKILEEEDWRSCDSSFQAAVHAIRGETDEALTSIRHGVASEQLSRMNLVEWPVFDDLRKLKKFKKLFAELFGEDAAEKIALGSVELGSRKAAPDKFLTEVSKQISELAEVVANERQAQQPAGEPRAPVGSSKLRRVKSRAGLSKRTVKGP